MQELLSPQVAIDIVASYCRLVLLRWRLSQLKALRQVVETLTLCIPPRLLHTQSPVSCGPLW